MTKKAKPYNPSQVEERIYKLWEKGKYFIPKIDKKKKPFVVTIPPPNITGALHMGHALNSTIQDVLVRYHRMKQEPTLWVPGTDHAGIATQNVVEKELKKEGLTRHDLGREKFVERVWQWKEKYGNLILNQLKKIGCSCDWTRTRFTMDKGYTQAILEAFIHYYKKGYIYQGPRIVNWCTRCSTAISDIEIKYEPHKTKLWYLKYPFNQIPNSKFKNHLKSYNLPRPHSAKQGGQATGYVTVATTRPETMLGDTAVAVNPKDERYKDLIGKTVLLPLMNREIPIIADRLVDSEFGTGAVKITPAHDATDNKIGKTHKLETINIIGEDGKMAKAAGKYEGLKITECRKKIVEDLKNLGLLEKEEDYDHSLALCDRCGTTVEPLISTQWFVKMHKLASPAIKVVEENKIRLIPERYKKVYLDWMKNLEDWCISRQLWWGHRLPVWHCQIGRNSKSQISNPKQIQNSKFKIQNKETITVSIDESDVSDRSVCYIVSINRPKKCPFCGKCQMKQSEDVLDTWFSSALWPFAVFGWPKLDIRCRNDFEKFYPTSFLSTAQDIIYLWVARMIFSSLELTGQIPFKDVYIHSTILTLQGQRMSKSLGIVIDPIDLIEKYGADATRFGLLYLTSRDQQVLKFSEDAIKASRLFANKIWNINRFINLSHQNFNNYRRLNLNSKLQNPKVKGQRSNATLADKWILSQLNTIIKEITEKLENYQLGEAVRQLYDFVWHEYADWYLEMSKLFPSKTRNHLEQSEGSCSSSEVIGSLSITATADTIETSSKQLQNPIKSPNVTSMSLQYDILRHTFQTILRLLHPFMPFITEHLWQANYPKANPLIISQWPEADEKFIDKKTEEEFEKIKQAVITARKENPGKKLGEIDEIKSFLAF